MTNRNCSVNAINVRNKQQAQSKCKVEDSKLKTTVKNSNLLKSRAYNFSVQLINFLDKLQGNGMLSTLINQLLRSGTSIGANLIEAQSASSKRDFTNYFQIALKSANETKYWLCLLRDTRFCGEEEINKLLKELREIANMIGASVLTLKGKRI